jgi:hypothetical protein
VEPPVYIDSASNETGPVDLRWPVGLLQEHAQGPAVVPEQVAAMNARIDANAGSLHFPRLRSLAAQAQALVDLKPRVVLSEQLQALLYFVYNGAPVDSRRLLARQAAGIRCTRSRETSTGKGCLNPSSQVCWEPGRKVRRVGSRS